MRRARGPLRCAVASVLISAASAPLALDAQTLDRVESLARDGRAAEARDALVAWWEGESGRADRTKLQRAIWLRATLTLDPEDALIDYRRLTVEYPGGPYTDRALLRLGQEAAARQAWVQAARAMETLVRDHPGSSLVADARSWLERHRDDVAREETAAETDPPASERSAAGAARPALSDAPPVRGGTPARTSDGARAAAPAGDEPGAATADFAVQLGAFSTVARARVLEERARRAGLEPRLVTVAGSPLVRVRVGRFPDEGAAGGLRGRALDLGFEAMVVRGAGAETPVR